MSPSSNINNSQIKKSKNQNKIRKMQTETKLKCKQNQTRKREKKGILKKEIFWMKKKGEISTIQQKKNKRKYTQNCFKK